MEAGQVGETGYRGEEEWEMLSHKTLMYKSGCITRMEKEVAFIKVVRGHGSELDRGVTVM